MSGHRANWSNLTPEQQATHNAHSRRRYKTRKEQKQEAEDRQRDTNYTCVPCLVDCHRSHKQVFPVVIHQDGVRIARLKLCNCKICA